MFVTDGTDRSIPFSGGSSGIRFGRVVDVVLATDHPDIKDYGNTAAIGGVFYRQIDSAGNEEDNQQQFAYQGNVTYQQIPLKNEIVAIMDLPTWERGDDNTSTVAHWLYVCPLWNHPHHNAYPDTEQYPNQSDKADFGKDFKEQPNVNAVQMSPGDIAIEGRHGQSIRLGGTSFEKNEISTEEDNGKPYVFISNGQKETEDGLEIRTEDINEDKTSLYLTSDQQIPLTQANEKRDAYKEAPETAEAYKGAQTIINSNRIFLNAKEDAVLISSLESVGINTKAVAIDGEDYVGIDAKKIYLGSVALKREDEPVLLGQSTTEWLEDLHSVVNQIVNHLATMPVMTGGEAKGVALGSSLIPLMAPMKAKLELLKSKKVFTE